MAKPFQAVERLPVPPEVAESFRELGKTQKGEALSHYGGRRKYGYGHGVPGTVDAARERATAKLAQATERAAAHFGGDVEKMTTHFKRFVRWGGRAMGVAEMVLPKESFEKGMEEASNIMSKVPKRLRVKRRSA